MATDILETAELAVTRAAIECKGCGNRGPNYQITTSNGQYVQLCESCVEQVAVAVRADQNRAGG